MKKLFAILSFLVPLIAFGDLLPEPGILTDKENSDLIVLEESGLNNDNTIDNENNIDSTTITIDEKDGIVEEDEFDPLSNVAFGFCDKELESTTYSFNGIGEEGKPIEVCLIFQNLSDRDISIDTSLYTTDYDDIGMIACTQDKSLSNFITSGNLGIITIPAENYLIRTFEITFPIGFSGEQNGCFGYRAPSEGEVEGVEFFVRKVFLMKFFIGSVDIKNELTARNLTTKLDDNGDLILSFWVENIGNMENTFDIQGNVKGLFGYNKKFESSDTAQLAPSRSQYFELNLGSLPSYGGKFDIDFTINGTPYFSYDISNANVDPARLEPKSWTFGTTYFKMPWLILAVVVVFILLLIVLFRKPKQKVVYIQAPQQSTQPQQSAQQPVQQPTQQYTQPVQPSQPVQQPVQQSTQPIQQPQQPQNPNYPQN